MLPGLETGIGVKVTHPFMFRMLARGVQLYAHPYERDITPKIPAIQNVKM